MSLDPYTAWLDIPPGPRPPGPEVLLGVSPGETDEQAILQAAMRRKNRLDDFTLSEHKELAAELVKEVADAMLLLLKRAATVAEEAVASPQSKLDVDEVAALIAGIVPPAEPSTPSGQAASAPIDLVSARMMEPPRVAAVPPRTLASEMVRHAQTEGIEGGHTLKDLERAAVMIGPAAAPDRPVVVKPAALRPEVDIALGEETSKAKKGQADSGPPQTVLAILRMDALLKAIVGEENVILHNFLRLLVPMSAVGVLWFGISWLGGRDDRPPPADSPGAPAAVAVVSEPPQPPETDGFVSLFDGTDLSRWKQVGQGTGNWGIEDRAIVARRERRARGAWLIGREDFGDFVLRFEIRIAPGAACYFTFSADVQATQVPTLDAFLMARPSLANAVPARGIPIVDGQSDALLAGVFAGRDPESSTMPTASFPLKPPDAWNDMEFEIRGGVSLRVAVNGESVPAQPGVRAKKGGASGRQVWRASLTRRSTGGIGFQAANGEVRLRNIRIKTLAENPQIVAGLPLVSGETPKTSVPPFDSEGTKRLQELGAKPLRLQTIPSQTVEAGETLTVAVLAEGAKPGDPSLRLRGWSGSLVARTGEVLTSANIFRLIPARDRGSGTYSVTLSVEAPDGRKANTAFVVTIIAARSPQPGIPTPVQRSGLTSMPPIQRSRSGKTAETPSPTGKVGRVASTKQVLLRLNAMTGEWERLPDGADLCARDKLRSLPTFRPRIVLGGVTAELVDGTAISLLAPVREGSAAIDVRFGRVLARAEEPAQPSLRVVAGGHAGMCRFADAESLVGVVVNRARSGTAAPDSQSRPLVGALYVVSGIVAWHDEAKEKVIRAGAPARLIVLGGEDDDVQLNDSDKNYARWSSDRGSSAADERASAVLENDIALGRSVVEALRELTNHRQREVRSLSMRSLSLVEEYAPLLLALNDPEERLSWHELADELQAAVFRDPESAVGMRAALVRQFGSRGVEMYGLLWKYRRDAIRPGDASRLVELLDHSMLPFRILAFWNLRNLYGTTNSYRPEESLSRRRPAIMKWRQQVQAAQRPGELPLRPD